MRKSLLLFFLISVGCSFSQTIENVDFRAEGKSIVVTYDFLHQKADTAINLELVFRDQQGSVITPKTISGDLKNVKPGEGKRIVWDILRDGFSLKGKYKVHITIQKNLPIVKIGSQTWTTENLNVDRFRNGDPIPEAKTAEDWIKAAENMEPAWCYYENDSKNGALYGKLYNWYAVSDPRGLAPSGWHIPSDGDWITLTDFLRGKGRAGNKMKSMSGWLNNGSNESGFSGLPGGYRFNNGVNNCDFYFVGNYGAWWSASEYYTKIASNRSLNHNGGSLGRNNCNKGRGLSVRCLRD